MSNEENQSIILEVIVSIFAKSIYHFHHASSYIPMNHSIQLGKHAPKTLFWAIYFCLFLCSFESVYSQKKIGVKDQQKVPVFREVDPEVSGVKFMNLTPGPPDLKKDSRLFTVASGGTSVGDVNGDGLIDIYLTSFIGKNTLFINKGNLKFEAAPESAGVTDSAGYGFGSTMIDIDGDGDLDIYVTKYNQEPNKLFINDGKGVFTEKAKEFGLATIGNGIQSTFFDYDLDGDLDVLIVNNGISRTGFKHEGVTPILMRNNGNNSFSDVTANSGIDHKGFGLSATAADINNDGWPDFYIANDFEEKDYLYINTKDGRFERATRKSLPHTVMFGMGNDVADFNNDNLMDIIAVDMLPELHVRLNTQFENFSTYNVTFDSTQFIQNTLQLNRGNGRFSDIAQMSGVDATEWSWTVFFADFNLDGFKDIFVANGLNWDIMDKDLRRLGVTHEMMLKLREQGYEKLSASAKAKGDMRELAEEFDVGKLIRDLKRTRIPNYLFKNNGDLTFSKVTNDWGMNLPYNTCSSSYADFDNDGDLDLILNTIDTAAVLYENTMMNSGKNNYLKVSCIGNTKNTQGIGARVQAKIGNQTQTFEIASTRGFATGVASLAHFGLGASTMVDELIVTWPGGKQQKLTKVKSNQHIKLYQANASDASIAPKVSQMILKELTQSDSGTVKYLHRENVYDDFYNERLLPNQLSINGPALASGDVNGDGLHDVIIGGAQGFPLTIFHQQSPGAFTKAEVQEVFHADSLFEDQGILLFDAELDGDLDIYVASGGNEMAIEKPSLLQDRLYINNGKGVFTRRFLPDMPYAKSCVIGNDFDKDGDIDLFVGGRSIPGAFSKEPRSYILLNTNGNFTDVTTYLANPLLQPGRVKSALWSDYDNDGDKDLFVIGEWMKILLLQNSEGVFLDKSAEFGLDTTTGMWNSINAGDFDNDGDMDYVIGNVGINRRYDEPSNQYPFELFTADFDDNGSVDYLQSYYENGIRYPSRIAGSLINQIPTIWKSFLNIEDLAKVNIEKFIGGDSILKKAQKLSASMGKSVILINNGKAPFTIKSLPVISQASPLYGSQIIDINFDGNLDIIHAGNFYGPDRDSWRYDAGIGEVLMGDGKGNFTPTPVTQSGFFVPGEGRSMISYPLKDKNELHIVVGSCKDSIRTFAVGIPSHASLLQVDDKEIITHAILQYKSGNKRFVEFYNGFGYYSQQPRFLIMDQNTVSATFYNNETIVKTVKKSTP